MQYDIQVAVEKYFARHCAALVKALKADRVVSLNDAGKLALDNLIYEYSKRFVQVLEEYQTTAYNTNKINPDARKPERKRKK